MENSLKTHRIKKGISQNDLAKAIKVSRQNIYLIEKGKITPKLNMAFKIAGFFNLKIEDLFKINKD